MKWISVLISKIQTKPNLSQLYWDMQISLVRDEVGVYQELSLGWIYSGLYDQDVYGINKQTIGRGWYRHNLGVL